MSLGALSFAAPWVLAGLAALPVIWWLLRALPPAAQRVRFPALQFLLGLPSVEETPVHMPLWLLLLRMAVAALLIVGLAGPVLNARPPVPGTGPLAIVIDTGWTSAPGWTALQTGAVEAARSAARTGRTVVLVRTAPAAPQSFAPMAGSAAESQIAGLAPQPWRPDRMAVLDAWRTSGHAKTGLDIAYFADGVDHGDTSAFANGLAALGALTVHTLAPGGHAAALRLPRAAADRFAVDIVRLPGEPARDFTVTAFADRGRILARASASAPAGETLTTAEFALPQEIRNDIRMIAIAGESSAGAVALLDDRWRRPTVGLLSGQTAESAQPLLSDLYYLERAMEPFADVRTGTIDDLFAARPSALILADIGRVVGTDHERIAAFVEAGGLLVRFAGPRMASQSDDLVPLPLRQGGRTIGGALSWSEPQTLGPFDENSPFHGMSVPGDVSVSRQVLVEPSLQVAERTWARLIDGTPLVTAAPRGQGMVVLFHVSANPDWSNLPLSGTFVEMLQRVLIFARGAAAEGEAAAPGTALGPLKLLDGFGTLRDPPGTAAPIAAGALDTARPSPAHPPGLYGSEASAFALNTVSADETLTPAPPWPAGAGVRTLGAETVRRLGPLFLALAVALLIADSVAALLLSGRLGAFGKRRHAAAALTLFIGMAVTMPRTAQAAPPDAMAAALETRLAYIVTGDQATDTMSLAGLDGLSRRIADKTALAPAAPVGLDVESDDLSLYPLLYWPMVPGMTELSADALGRIDRYLKTGGMILFDTRDRAARAAALGSPTDNEASLRAVLGNLDVPPLEVMPEAHVLRRSFYLLDACPAHQTIADVWVETTSAEAEEDGAAATTNDGVSSVIIGAEDWASAWAVDAAGRPIAPVSPGGERQRECDYRFGVNLAMYALTGNYKADQVHTRALIERLGE